MYEEANQFEEAEKVYRKSVQIKENLGIIFGKNGAIANWNALACITESLGKDKESEAWYRKAIEHGKDMVIASLLMNNLANLLQNNPNRLPEAQQFAEQALAIKKTLDPETAEIWKNYEVLAREAKANFAGTQYELKQEYSELILAVARGENVAAALKRYDDERDVDFVCEPLNYEEAPIMSESGFSGF